MTTSTQWQLARTAAERYQTILTPSILGPFAETLLDFVTLPIQGNILDVGCGTGAAAREAARQVASDGQVTGVDINAGMIEIARAQPANEHMPINWHIAPAARLPLPDQSVNGVLCAQTLQFLPEKQASLAEIRRVLTSDGWAAFSLWCCLEENPYFEALVTAVADHINPATAVGLRSAFALCAAVEIEGILRKADFTAVEMSVTRLDLLLPPLTEFVPRHISATPMVDGFEQAPPAKQQIVVQAVIEKMTRYEINGRVRVPFKSHMIRCFR